MAVPRSVRIGCCFVLLFIPWFFVLRSFWRLFYTSSDDLWQSIFSAAYIPILAFLATLLIRRWNQRVAEKERLSIDPSTFGKGGADRWIALALVLAGTASAVSWWGWISTRSLRPFEMPISLSPGHVQTSDFTLNVPSEYAVYIGLDRKPDFDDEECLLGFGKERCRSTQSVLDVSWKLTQSGRTVAEGGTKKDPRTFEDRNTLERGLGGFFVNETGRFALDVSVLGDTGQLNSASPRLGVAEVGGVYWEFRSQTGLVLSICIFAALFGMFLWVRTSGAAGSSPAPPGTPSSSAKKLPSQIWIGGTLLLIAIPTFIGVYRWIGSRIFEPLNMPISLAKGQIRAEPFKINLSEDYRVRIDTGRAPYFDPNCPSYDRVKAHWVLYRDGKVVAKWLGYDPYAFLGSFYAESGTYVLNLEVLSETSCLNPGHPRLVILTSRDPYVDRATQILWLAAFLTALGASLIVLGIVEISTRAAPSTTLISDLESVGQNFQWAQKLPLRQKFSSPPAFALIALTAVFITVIVFMTLAPYPAKGLYVDLVKPGPTPSPNDPFNQPVLVQIVDAGPGKMPKLYVNSKVTTWEDLSSALKDELKVRPRWEVQVEGDENIPYADAVNVMAVAKNLSARVVMLTSKPAPGSVPKHKARNTSKR